MKNLMTVFILVLCLSLLSAVDICSWNFDTDSILPTTGSGTLSLIGSVTSDGFNTGNTGRAWSTTGYPAQGTNTRTAGLYIEVSSLGYNNISLAWNNRHSNTSANREVLFYTLDKTASSPVWMQAAMYNATAGDAWLASSFNGSSISGLANNSNLAFKIVSSFADTTNTAYVASNSSSTYAGGKWRWDNIILSGTPTTPSLQITSDLQPFYAAPSFISDIQTYGVAGQNLVSNVVITAPQYFLVRLLGSATFSDIVTLVPQSGTLDATLQVVFQPVVSGVFTDSIEHVGGGVSTQYVEVSGSTILPEPSNHPTRFDTGTITYYQAYLNWTDSSGVTLPDGYLIKGSKVDAASIVDPVDGVVEEDKKLTKNVAYGVQTQLIYELNEAHIYYFKIFPYTNSGLAIDYKTDGEVPLLSFTTSAGPIGSTLSIGDLAFVEYACDSPDRFSFVLLTDVLENTIINFTDKGWTGSAFASTEETYEWRGVERAYAKGEVIHIEEGILHSNEGIYNPDFEGFSNSGDQIIAYQGYLTDPSFIAAFSSTDWISSGTPTTNTSYLPVVLTLGENALAFSTELDNGVYTGSQTGSVSEIRQAINNPINWTRNNSLNNITFSAWNFSFDVLSAPEIQITSVDANNVLLSWLPISGATAYTIYFSALPDASFPADWSVLISGITANSYQTTSGVADKRFYKVTATN